MGHWANNHVDNYFSPILSKSNRKRKYKTMANSKPSTLVFRGRLQYARVLGDPVLNYNKDGQEWKFDFVPNDPDGAEKELNGTGANKVSDRLRALKDSEGNPRYEGQKYMSFKQAAERRDGTPNTPIRVEDVYGNNWPEDVLLGNDTVVDVKFVVIDNGPGKFPGVYPRSIRVLDLVPYQSKEFDPIDETDPYFVKAAEAAKEIAMLKGTPPKAPENTNEELDDEIPV